MGGNRRRLRRVWLVRPPGPSVSAADALYVLGYVAVAVGLVRVIRARKPGRRLGTPARRGAVGVAAAGTGVGAADRADHRSRPPAPAPRCSSRSTPCSTSCCSPCSCACCSTPAAGAAPSGPAGRGGRRLGPPGDVAYLGAGGGGEYENSAGRSGSTSSSSSACSSLAAPSTPDGRPHRQAAPNACAGQPVPPWPSAWPACSHPQHRRRRGGPLSRTGHRRPPSSWRSWCWPPSSLAAASASCALGTLAEVALCAWRSLPPGHRRELGGRSAGRRRRWDHDRRRPALATLLDLAEPPGPACGCSIWSADDRPVAAAILDRALSRQGRC